MLKKIIYLLLIFHCFKSKAQGYFSTTYELGYGEITLDKDAKILNDSIVLLISNFYDEKKRDSTSIYKFNLRTEKIDKSLNFRFDTTFYANYIGSSIVQSRFSPFIYVAGKELNNTLTSSQMIILKLNYNLDTIGTFRTQSGLANEGSAIIEGRDSCLYITGTHYSASHIDSTSILLAKFRPDGTNVWEKFYDIPDTAEQGYMLVQDKQGNIFISQNKSFYYGLVSSIVQVPLFLKINENGDLIFRKQMSSPLLAQCGNSIMIDENQEIYFLGCSNWKSFVGISDTFGNLKFKSFIDFFNYDTTNFINIFNIKKTKSDDYIISGTVNIVQIKYPNGKYGYMSLAGYVAKMSGSSGKMLWERMYTTRWKDWAQNYIVAMDLMPNGDIVTLGSAPSLTDTSRNDKDQWLMYLDSNGCLSPTDCGAEWMRYRAPLSLQDGNVELVVYPNPFDTHLDLRCTSYTSQSMQLKVVHAGGAVLYNAPFDPSLPLHIDTDQWPKGLYILSVTDDSHMIQSYKLWK